MSTKPKLQYTKNYNIFEMNEINRGTYRKPLLERSMREHGFMPSSPIHCVPNGKGKLKVVRGHHRLECAMRLGIGVWFIVDTSCQDLYILEGINKQQWSATDFAVSRARSGHAACGHLIDFAEAHGIAIACAATLVAGRPAVGGGETGGASYGHDISRRIKMGTFKGGDMTHANQVVEITDLCRAQGVEFATASAFVGAVSLALRVPAFDPELFCKNIRLYAANMNKRSRREEYLEEIEELYNYRSSAKRRLNVKFQAMEIARQRARTFGGTRAAAKKTK